MSQNNVDIIESDVIISNKNINVSNLVTKSNELIEASFKLSTEELKTIELLASVVEPDDTDFKPYRFKISDYMQIIGVKNKSKYRDMQEVTKNLMKKVFTIKFQNYTLQTAWLSSAKYYPGEGVVDLTFDPNLKPFYLGLKERFTSYKLQNVIRLKSNYSIRIYTILKQYEKIGERTMELDRLREIVGLENNEYPLYADFKKRVIITAQKELREKTDIYFEFEEIKKSRKVDKIRFLVYPNKVIPIKDCFGDSVFNRLVNTFGFSDEKANEILSSYNEVFITDTLDKVEKEYKKGNIKDLQSYTYASLVKNYSKLKQNDNIDIKSNCSMDLAFEGTKYEEFIVKLKNVLTEISYRSWISNLLVDRFENDVLYLRSIDDMSKGIVEIRYMNILKDLAFEVGIKDIILL